MRGIFGLFLIGLLAVNASARPAAQDPEFEAFQDSFSSETDQAIAEFDRQTPALQKYLLNGLLNLTKAESDSDFTVMNKQECEALKSRIVKSSPIDPFKIKINPGYTREITFCEPATDYRKVVFGRLPPPTKNHLGVPVSFAFVRIFKDFVAPSANETERLSAMIYLLDAADDIVEIASIELIDHDRSFVPAIKAKGISRDSIGDVYFHSIDIGDGLLSIDYRIPLSAMAVTVSRESSQVNHPSGGATWKLERISSFRPDKPSWMSQYLILPAIMHYMYGYEGGRLYSNDGIHFGESPSSFELLHTKKINGRAVCSFGLRVQGVGTGQRAELPANTDDREYCETIF